MELLLLTVAPSIAAVVIYGMKLYSKKPKPFVHEHIWGPWEEENRDRIVHSVTREHWDTRVRYKRECIDCGFPEYKIYSILSNMWT